MQDKKHDLIVKLVHKWKPVLFLHDWDVKIIFAKEDPPDSEEEICSLVVCNFNTTYKILKMTIYPVLFDRPKASIEFAICHELCHAVTGTLADSLWDLRNGKLITPDEVIRRVEQATQHLTNIVIDLDRRLKK